MYTTFELSTSNGIGHLRFNRPESLNSMTHAFWSEFPDAINTLDQDGNTRVLIISSTGAHFSSGMDLSVFQQGDSLNVRSAHNRDSLRRLVIILQEAFNCLERCRMPVIAAIQGGCIGGALDMASACCIRLCTADAFFKIQEINLGMMADLGVLQRLPRLLPAGVCRELAYTGDPLSAERAATMGFVNEIFPDHDALMAGALKLAAHISRQSPLAVAASKESLNYSRDHAIADSLQHAANLQAAILNVDDLMECMGAKKEKRSPTFSDLPAIKARL